MKKDEWGINTAKNTTKNDIYEQSSTFSTVVADVKHLVYIPPARGTRPREEILNNIAWLT